MHQHSDLLRKRGGARPSLNSALGTLLLSVGGLLCLIWWALGGVSSAVSSRALVKLRGDIALHVPNADLIKAQSAGRTVYVLPGRENRCQWQYNYLCKFFFYIRCFVLAGFESVEIVQSVAHFTAVAKAGDVALVVWRSKNHSCVPPDLDMLLDWRKNTYNAPRVRIGVLHIANEVLRQDWPWYVMPDFIVRNYWMPNMPKHAVYVPLGPQLPQGCVPDAPVGGQSPCACSGVGFQRASERKYLWNFGGSLRKRRGELLRRLRQSRELRTRGFVQVSSKFGGDGVFGDRTYDPKNAYLDAIHQSQFVFAPCGNAMETHRIYEAIALGAIPIVEKCENETSDFFPLKTLVIDGGPEAMVEFLKDFRDKPVAIDVLQRSVAHWWKVYTVEIARNVSNTVFTHVAPSHRIPSS